MNESQKGLVFSEIVLEVFKLGGLLINKGDQMGMEYGVTSARWKILGAIFLAGEPQTVPQIARRMGLTRQGVQRHIDTMQKDGLLLFQHNPDHKRAKLIDLSDMGREICIKLDEKQARQATIHSSNISKNDLETTLSVLQRISNTIDH